MANTIQLEIRTSTEQTRRAMRAVVDDIRGVGKTAAASGRDAEILGTKTEQAGRNISTAMKRATQDVVSSLRKARGEGDAFGRSLKEIGDTAAQASSRLALIGGAGAAAFGALGLAALKTAASMEQTRVSFTTLLHSSEAARKSLTELANFAKETPFEFGQVTDASKKLLAYGFTAKQLIPTLRTLGDAAGSLGLDSGGLDRLIVAFGQIRSKAKLELQDLRQLAEAGIPVFDILQKNLGLTAEQVQNIGKAGIDSKAGLAALTKGMQDAFGGGMERQAKTMNGIISNLADTWSLFLSNVEGTGLGDIIAQDAKPALEDLLATVNRLKSDGTLDRWASEIGQAMGGVAKAVGQAIEAFGRHPEIAMFGVKLAAVGTAATLAAAGLGLTISAVAKLAPAMLLVGRAATTALTFTSLLPAIGSVKDAIALLTATMGPVGIAIAGITAAVGAAALAWRTNFLGIRDRTQAFFRWFGDNAPGINRIWDGVCGRLPGPWQDALNTMSAAWDGFWARWHRGADNILGFLHRIDDAGNRVMSILGGGNAAPSLASQLRGYVEGQTVAARGTAHPFDAYAPLAGRVRLPGGMTPAEIRAASAALANGASPIPMAFKAALPSRQADTTRGVSPGAAKYSAGAEGDKERAAWREEARGFFDNIQDYLKARGVNPSGLRVTNTSHGAHARYRAMDIGGPRNLYPMVIEAAHALGLKVSDESGPGKYSAKATGPHLHIFKPTEGQQAAYQAQEKADQDAARRAEERKRAAEEAARQASERARRIEEETRAADARLEQTGGMTARLRSVRNAVGLPVANRYDTQTRDLTGALRTADETRRRAREAVGSGTDAASKAALARIDDAWISERKDAYRKFYAEIAELRQQDLENARRAAEEKFDAEAEQQKRELDAYQERGKRLKDIRDAEAQDRYQQRKAAAALDQTDIQAAKDRYDAEIVFAALMGDDLRVRELQLQKSQDLRRVTEDVADAERTRAVQALELDKEILDAKLLVVKTLAEQKAVLEGIETLERRIAAVRAGRSDPGNAPAPKNPHQADIDAEERYQKDRVNLAKQADEAIAQSWSHRVVGLAFGETKNFFKGLMDDLKNIFRRWLEETLAMQLLYRRRAGEYSPGKAGGIFGVLGSIFGGGPGMGIVGGERGGVPTGIPGIGDIGGLKAVQPYLIAGTLGAMLGKGLFGRGGGTGGGLGAMLGLAVGGPAGGLIGSLAGGLISGLFGGKRHHGAPAFYQPTVTTPNLYALSPDSYRTAKPNMGNSRTVIANTTQINNFTTPRPIETVNNELAGRVARSLRAR